MFDSLLAWLDRSLPFGSVGGRFFLAPLRLRDRQLPAVTSSPLATRFVIGPLGTGWPSALFFGCVGSGWRRRSPYADPRSPWHNVFFGDYEVRVDALDWGRPFAFSEASEQARPLGPEMLKLGQADWNDLSNGPYGVPREAAAAHDALVDAWVEEQEPL